MNRLIGKKRTWQESFEALKRYKDKHGDTFVPIHTCKEDPALGGWVNHQRSKKEKLSEEQRQLLDSIGFAWSCRNRNKTWNPMIEALQKFQQVHEHCDVPEVYPDDPKLADFVKEQRAKYHRGQLSAARLKQLQAIGLKFKREEVEQELESEEEEETDEAEAPEEEDDADKILYDNAFKQQYQKLVDFQIKFGHCRVPKFSRRGETLGLWVAALKRKYAENPANGMESRCLELLEELDFFTTSGPAPVLPNAKSAATTDDEDNSDSEVLSAEEEEEQQDGVAAASKNGSNASSEEEEDGDDEASDSEEEEEDDKSDVESVSSSSSSSSSDLDSDKDEEEAKEGDEANVSKKRRLSNLSQSSSSKRNRANYRDERFMKQFQDLMNFKKEHGHCRVPQSKRFKTLGGWVNNLRVMYNRDPENGVRPDRKKLLDTAGFVWNAGADRPGNDARWEEQYKHLVEFKTNFGHCRVPQTGPHRKLGRWVATQRALFVKDPENGIRSDRLQRLNDIEFTWDAKGFKGRHFYSIQASKGRLSVTDLLDAHIAKPAPVKAGSQSDATESDEDDAVAAQVVDSGHVPIKVEEGVANSVDAVAIPTEQPVDAVAATTVSAKIEDAGPEEVKATLVLAHQSPNTATTAPVKPAPVDSATIEIKSEIQLQPPVTCQQSSISSTREVEGKPLVKHVSLD